MTLFRYEALDRSGNLVMGAMQAANPAEVDARLSSMGYRTRAVAPAPGAAPSTQGAASTFPANAVITPSASPKALAVFFRQFASMARAGISPFQALETLAPRTSPPALSEAVTQMSQAARNGEPVSGVMERYPRLFPHYVVAGMQGAETGGFLDIVLDEIATDYEQELAFYKTMWLPRLLVIQGIVAIAIAQPVFPHIFPNGNPALYFQLLLFRNLPITAGVVFLGFWFHRRMQLPERRDQKDRFALKMPVFGDLARQRALLAFIRMLRRLFDAGLSPASAWEGAMRVAPNLVIRDKLVEAHGLMKQNIPMHDAFSATGLFASESEQLLATGVVTGQMVDMLDRVAVHYQDNMDRAFKRAQFYMMHLSLGFFLALSGLMMIIMVKNYFKGIFDFVENF